MTLVFRDSSSILSKGRCAIDLRKHLPLIYFPLYYDFDTIVYPSAKQLQRTFYVRKLINLKSGLISRVLVMFETTDAIFVDDQIVVATHLLSYKKEKKREGIYITMGRKGEKTKIWQQDLKETTQGF